MSETPTCTAHCWHPLTDSYFPVPRTDERCCRCGKVKDHSNWPGVSWSFTPEHYSTLGQFSEYVPQQTEET